MATASKQTPSDPKPAPARNVPMAHPVNGSVRVEIFDQIYNLRGSDAEYILKLGRVRGWKDARRVGTNLDGRLGKARRVGCAEYR